MHITVLGARTIIQSSLLQRSALITKLWSQVLSTYSLCELISLASYIFSQWHSFRRRRSGESFPPTSVLDLPQLSPSVYLGQSLCAHNIIFLWNFAIATKDHLRVKKRKEVQRWYTKVNQLFSCFIGAFEEIPNSAQFSVQMTENI